MHFFQRSQCKRNDGFRVTNNYNDIQIQSNYRSYFAATIREIFLFLLVTYIFSQFHADLHVSTRNSTVPFVSSYNGLSHCFTLCNFMVQIRFLLNINTLGNARYRVLTAVVINLVSWDAVFCRHVTNISDKRSASVFRVQQNIEEWLPDPEATCTCRKLFTSWQRKIRDSKTSIWEMFALPTSYSVFALSVLPYGFSFECQLCSILQTA
jgi:hypothetical protein